jgi:hypothetical protein
VRARRQDGLANGLTGEQIVSHDAMRERLEEFALTPRRADRLLQHRSASASGRRLRDMREARLDPEKTRLIEFGRHAAVRREQRGLGKPETFNFLGFTFICGTSRQGNFLIRRKTRRDRMKAKLQELKGEPRRRMHRPIPEQGQWLKQVVSGFFNYHAVPTNSRALSAFRYHVTVPWHRTLRRRSQRDRFSWERITKLVDDWLPRPRILHPWPSVRFAVRHPRWEPYAGKPHVRFCAGDAQ